MNNENRQERPRWRVPAREIERAVAQAVDTVLRNPARLASEAAAHETQISALIEGARDWWGKPLELVQRVELRAGELALDLELSPVLGEAVPVIRAVIPARLQRRGIEMRLILETEKGDPEPSRPDPALVRAIGRGRRWFEELASGSSKSIVEMAKAEGVTSHYVARMIPLGFLAPDVIQAILSGSQPVQLTAEALTKHIDIPLDWTEQRLLLGFDAQT